MDVVAVHGPNSKDKFLGEPKLAKCEHGSYIPAGEIKAVYCPLCNPDGVPEGPVPVLPRSSGDPLRVTRPDELALCQCSGMKLSSLPECPVCGLPFESSKGREQLSANVSPSGACPTCGSTVHYVSKKKRVWECADCGTEYPAPKQAAGKEEEADEQTLSGRWRKSARFEGRRAWPRR
jgi:ribosomal protein L37AE/L43A